MATTKINPAEVLSTAGRANSAKCSVSNAGSTVSAVHWRTDSRILYRNGISGRFANVQEQINQIAGDIERICTLANNAAMAYQQTENWILNHARDIGGISQIVIPNTSENTVTLEAFFGNNSQLGAVETLKEAAFVETNVVAEPNETVTASGTIRYKQPEYTQQGLYPDANGVWGEYVYHKDGSLGRICTWNRPGELSCTYYTLRKLNERGLSYPCTKGPGSGTYWYGNFDTEAELPRYGGNQALYDLVGNLSLPQENIVVSLASNTGTTAEFRAHGHVMLIDRIYKDANGNVLIDYSDNWPIISDVNGSNPVMTKTIDSFMAYYNKYNGNINGIVVMGAGN